MRQVGDIAGQRRADRFLAFLAHQGIAAQLRDEGDERFSVWVIEEDSLAPADEHFRAYKAAPEAPVFDAPALREAPPPRPGKTAGRSRYIDVRTEIFGRGRAKTMPVVIALIAVSVLLTLASGIPNAISFVRALHFSEYSGRDFPEIMDGQVWRLVTPIFLHGGMLHLLFNMLWVYQLGGAIEINEGSRYTALLVFVTACLVNTAQYLVSGPMFVGMSGVVYALFGYVWMMSRYQAASRYFLAQQTVVIMLVWLVACVIELIPGVANTEHVAGLVVGVVWGFLRSGQLRTLERRRRYKG